MQGWLWWAHTLQAMVCMGRAMPTAAGGQGGEDAQASSPQPLDLLPLPDHECHDRRLQQRHPGPEVRGTRLPLLRQLPDSHPVLLRQARSQAAATLPLKSRKNPKHNWRESWGFGAMLNVGLFQGSTPPHIPRGCLAYPRWGG